MYSDNDLNVEYMFFVLTNNNRSREKGRKNSPLWNLFLKYWKSEIEHFLCTSEHYIFLFLSAALRMSTTIYHNFFFDYNTSVCFCCEKNVSAAEKWMSSKTIIVRFITEPKSDREHDENFKSKRKCERHKKSNVAELNFDFNDTTVYHLLIDIIWKAEHLRGIVLIKHIRTPISKTHKSVENWKKKP